MPPATPSVFDAHEADHECSLCPECGARPTLPDARWCRDCAAALAGTSPRELEPEQELDFEPEPQPRRAPRRSARQRATGRDGSRAGRRGGS